jgi:prophage antirepressor-like protein
MVYRKDLKLHSLKFPVTRQPVRVYVDKQRTPWWDVNATRKIIGNPDTFYFGRLDDGRTTDSEHLYIITNGSPVHAVNLVKLLEVLRRSDSPHAPAFLDWTLYTVLPDLRRDPDYN